MSLPDWSAIHADAIEAISRCIANDADYVRFRSVCTSWRSAAPRRPHLPWILVVNADDGLDLSLCNFPSTDLSPPPRLPQGITRGKYVLGSSRGWVAVLDDAPGISLHNPFTGLHIRLPPLTNLPWVNKSGQGFVHRNHLYPFRESTSFLATKVVLCSDPMIVSCIVLAISNNCSGLIYCRPGDNSWTVLPPVVDRFDTLGDIIYYRGKFYAVCSFRVFVCDIRHGSAQIIEILPMSPLFSDGKDREFLYTNKTSYLVVSHGGLLLVSNTYHYLEDGDPDSYDCEKLCFEVFLVDWELNGWLRLVKMNNVGGCSLFVGSSSISVSAGSSPLFRGNCIYFIYEAAILKDAIVVYCMEDGSVSFIPGFSDDTLDFSENRFDYRDDRVKFSDGYWQIYWLAPSLC